MPTPSRAVLRSALAPASVAAVALACYANSLGGALLFDDLNAIVYNPAVQAFDLGRIFGTPSGWAKTDYVALYRPVTTLTFALDHALHGVQPLGYHAVNVALHAAVCLLLAVVLARVTGLRRTSLAAAVLFAAHPVHTEAVTSVVGRAEELAALLALTAWWLVLRARESDSVRAPWLLGAGLALAAGALAKESAVTIVAVAIAADTIYRRRGDPAGWAALAGGAATALALRTAVLGRVAFTPDQLDNVMVGAPAATRLATVLAVVARYTETLMWPFRLSADYSYRQVDVVRSLLEPGFLAGLAVVLMAAAAVWRWRRNRHVCFAVAFAALTFSVASNLVVLIGTTMAERLLYLPSVGFCLLVALGAEAVARRSPRPRTVAPALVAVLVLVWGAGTVARNRVWRDRLPFFEAMVASAPDSARSHRELGLVYSDLGRHDEAVRELHTSLRIAPGNAITLYDLGNVLLGAGRPADAVDAYTESLAHKPDLISAMTNAGNAESALGDERAAEQWFRRALARDPGSADAEMNLANSLYRQGRLDEAEGPYRQAIILAPRALLPRLNYAALLQNTGRHRDAAEHLRAAVALAPDAVQVRVRLVGALEAGGMRDEARAEQARAERLFPTDAAVRGMRQRLDGGG